MTEQEMQIATAESMGWRKVNRPGAMSGWDNWQWQLKDDETTWADSVPNFPQDLNAMHEVEKTLHWEPESDHCPAQEYYEHLIFICGRALSKGKPFGYVCHICGEQIYDGQATDHSESGLIHSACPEPDCYDWHLVTATALQRCEAYLRVKGLWKESTPNPSLLRGVKRDEPTN